MHISERIERWLRRDRPAGWNISAPFIFALAPGGDDPLDTEAWLAMLDAIASFASEIFFEAPLDHSGIWTLLEHCDALDLRTHIASRGDWSDVRETVHRLRALKRLGSVRLDGASDDPAALALCVAAGLEVWAVLPAAAADRARVEALVAAGVRGVAVTCGEAPADMTEIELLQRDGMRIVLEDCPATSCTLPGRCRGGTASCFIDAAGDVRACRRGAVLGNLRAQPITAIWQSPPAEALRARIKDVPGPLHRLYQTGCLSGARDVSPVSAEAPPPKVELDPTLVPVALFQLRRETFGAVAIRGFDFVPLTQTGWRIAAAIDGRCTLGALHQRFGAAAIELAYALFCEKMLRFARAGAPQIAPLVDEEAGP